MAPMRHSEHSGFDADDPFSPEQVSAALASVLESPAFKATRQRREMLKYVVDELIAGRGDAIKGYTIGIAVFGKGEDFDPNSDPLVRLEARRLRHDLDSYYVSEGRNDPLRIAIPTGRYVPKITSQRIERDAHEEIGDAGSSVSGENITNPVLRSYGLAGAAVVILAVIILGSWKLLQRHNVSEVATSTPAVAVIPFDVLSDNGDDEFLAAGISSQIVSDLNRFPDIRIYAPQAGFTQSPSAGPIELGEQLGVSHVVAGELRSHLSSIIVAARLIDARSGRILWTDTYERNLAPENLLAIQSEIAGAIASSLGQPYGVLKVEATQELPDHSIPSMASYECVLRGYNFRRTYSPTLYEPLLSCLEQAVQTDPDYAEAWAMLGFVHSISTALSILPSDPDKDFDTGAEAARHSIELDPENVLGLKVLSVINHYQGNYAESERYVRLALKINPNDPDTLYQLGWRLAIRGRFEEGVPLIERAIDRTIKPLGQYYHLLAIDRLMKKDGEGMLVLAQQASVDGSALSQSLIAMAYGLLGNRDAGIHAYERMNEITPGYDPVDRFRAHQATNEIAGSMNAALRKAGWPETSEAARQE